MAQVSYGTITITDTNDISRIYVEYCRSTSNQLSGTTVPNITRAWGETTPPWVDGEYIWQRAVVEKSGTLEKTYGTPVCISGEKGETGQQGPQGGTGAAGRSLKSTETQYTTAAANATITQNNMGNYTWSDNVPTYNTNAPAYWVRITNTYENPTKTVYVIYKDNGITDAVKTSADANATASAANTTAGEAKTQAAAADGKADTAIGTANTANTNATNALNIANGTSQHFWWIAEDTSTTGGTISAGAYITDIAKDTFKTNPGGYGNLLLRSDGVYLNLGLQTLASFKSNALTFYNSAGAELGKFGSTGLEMSGTLNIKGGGRIGQDSDNYWEFGDNKSYNDEDSAYLIGRGTASIQLGEAGHWRLDKNRIHTGWYQLNDSSSSTPAGSLHFDTGADGNATYYWDYGMHYPDKAGNGNNKFLYIRRSNDTTSTTLATMKGRIDDDTWWTYKFYVDGNGNVHAPGFYIGDSTTPIGGGAGTVAERLTQGYGSASQPIYFNSNGVPTNTTYQLNAAGAKGVDTSISAASTSTNLPTSQAVAAFVEGKGYITSYTDNKVQTSQANTTKIYLAGTSTAGTSTGTLNFDSNVYLTTTAGTLHATTFEGNLSGTASRATADGDGNTISTTYLKLTGGNVTGAVTFGSSVSADELTVGDLVVNGSASFTNNLQANTINGVAVGSNPKFTDTVTTVTVTGSGNAITGASASGGAVTLTKGTTFPTGSGTNGYLTKWTGANTIGNGPALGTDTAKFLNNKGEWAVPAGTGLTSVGASGSGGITISGSPITTSGTIAIGLDLSTAINGLGEGASPATREDYIVAQYAGGGTTTTSYHRRKLSNIFAALNSSDITTALGYTPYNSTNPNGYITANHTSTYSLPIAKYNTLGGVKPAYSSTGAASLTTAAATNTTTPTIAAKTTTSGRYYAVEIDKNGILFVNVPWTNVNSSYLTSSSTLNWNNVTQNRPTTAKGYGITDAIVNVSATSASGGSTTFTLTKSDDTTSTFDVVVYASAASQATDANYLTDGTSRYTVGNAKKPIYFDGGIPKASNGTEGTSTKPVYLSSGTITAGSLYAGGTAVTLNGSGKGASTASFYAPTSAGTTNQVLIGGGSAPTWKDISALTPSTATSATKADYLSTYAADGTNNLTALQAIFDSVPKSVGTAIRLQHGSHSMALGWFLDGYAKANAYGGWFISDYGTPTWVGVDNGTWNEQTFITNTNYTNYTVTKTGSGASGTWGINITGNAATASSATNATYATYDADEVSNTTKVTIANKYVKKAGDTMTGTLTVPVLQTGTAAANYFQSQKFRGQGTADSYYHAIDFGYASHDRVDFYEYGGIFCFHKHTGEAINSGDTILGTITTNGWEGNVVGNVTGNASTSTKATQDSDGNTITSSYLRRFPWWISSDTHNADDLRAGAVFAYNPHNTPTTGTLVAFDCSTNENYTLQLMGSYNADNALYYRNRNGDRSVWNSWQQLVYNSGTWGISITGNAATATTATSATQDGSGNTITLTYVKKAGDSMSGPLSITATGSSANFDEGIRLNYSNGNYAGLVIGGAANSTGGITDGAWWIGTSSSSGGGLFRKLTIAHNTGSAAGTYFYATSATQTNPNLRLPTSGTITSGNMDAVNGGTVYNAINNLSGSYVTLNTDQTITASQKTFTGATRWGSASKYGAVHYDTSLEALVFSFA